MTEFAYKDWHEKSRKFHLVWFLFLGGLLVINISYNIGKGVTLQLVSQLNDPEIKDFTLQLAREDITKHFIPGGVGYILALLSPFLGIFSYYMIKKSELSITDKKKILIQTRLESLLITFPILLVVGLLIALLSAYFVSNYKSITDLFSIWDYSVSIVLGSLFLGVLLASAWLEVKFFFSINKLIPRIGICFIVVILNLLSMFFVSYGVDILGILTNV